MNTYSYILGAPLEPRETTTPRPHVLILPVSDPNPRVSAMTLPRCTVTPLFYSQSTHLPVLRGRRCVRGALNWPQTGGLYNKFAFQALRLWDGPDNRAERLLHCLRPHDAPRGSANSRAHDLVNFGFRLRPATISPCTITMDHDAIICSMTDRLTRGPDKDVHVPSVGSQKYPSRGVDVIYL